MDGSKFLQGLCVPEPGHCSFPSSERLLRVLGPVVEPTTAGPGGRIADHSHRSPVGRKPVRDDRSRPAITLHRAFQKPECGPAIPPFHCKNVKHFTFVVNRAPQIAGLPVDPHEHLIKVPAPVRIPMTMNPTLADLRAKQRTKPVPPVPHGLVADVDATLGQQVFDLSQRQRVADIQHHRAVDSLRRTVEITKRIVHRRRLRDLTFQLKHIYSDGMDAPRGFSMSHTGAC